MFRENELDQLVELEFDPTHYNSMESCRDAYMATKLLSKYEDFVLKLDKDAVAIAKFRETEVSCKSVNQRFRNLGTDPLYKGSVVWLHDATKRKIQDILGRFNPEQFLDLPDWGPGATTRIKRRDASPQEKFQSEIGITRDLYDLLHGLDGRGYFPAWMAHLREQGFPSFEVGNKVITVPKNSRTNRVIAIEPGINLFYQKSVGKMVELALSGVGVDIHSQAKNQHLARLGSKTGLLTTVDFSSASDTIAREVARELLPDRWFLVMDSCRSHFGMLDGTQVKWEKFSSMGNGFTFPLETLIFFAMAKAVTEYMGVNLPVNAYGDDVILPTACYELYSELAAFYGFTINRSKTYSTGYFRESCGSHWYSGTDIKPVYFHRQLSSVDDIYRQCNAIRRLANRLGGNSFCDVRWKSSVDLLVRTVPKSLRLRIPESLGDGGFISNFDEACPVRARHYIEGYIVLHYGQTSITREDDRPGYLLAELWRLSKRREDFSISAVRPFVGYTTGLSQRITNDAMVKAIRRDLILDRSGEVGRNSVPLHRTKSVLSETIVRQWTDLGPWVKI